MSNSDHTTTTPKSVKLTKPQRKALEKAHLRQGLGITSRQDFQLQMLERLADRGYLDRIDSDMYQRDDGNVDVVYMITDAGEAVLAPAPEPVAAADSGPRPTALTEDERELVNQMRRAAGPNPVEDNEYASIDKGRLALLVAIIDRLTSTETK